MRVKLSCVFLVLYTSLFAQNNTVKMYEEVIDIPSYKVLESEPNPIFYTPEGYQNARLKIYPYSYIGNLTDEKISKKYKELILENEYIKLCVLPEIGGRLYYAKDKTDGHDILYHNHVIKPALIGMAGAWTSGGVEWNIPHHHRVSTFMPVDYTLEENADGSKTIWVGEFEKRQQMRWQVGLTLYPGKAYIETSIRLLNVTPYVHSFLIWANTAVPANENTQVFFPPDCERAVYHTKNDFTDWPYCRKNYVGIDFTEGVDVSWWKNIKRPTSFFAYGTQMDFVAGIDHHKKAGTVEIGDHHIFTGRKVWYWGNNQMQRMWDQMLTDNDGNYLELMMGLYSDNQPDYSWNQPFSQKSGTMYFTSLRNLTSVKNANKDMAVNLDFSADSILIELYATSVQENANLELSYDGKTVHSEKVSLSPSKTYCKTLKALSGYQKNLYKLTIADAKGVPVIAYQPPLPKNEPEPEIYKAPASPDKISSADELYLAGLRIEQFGNSTYDYMKYYNEALKRDPQHVLTHTQLGIVYLKNLNFEKAEEHLRKAVTMVTGNHKTAKYTESLYYLGLALYHQEKYKEALDMFYKAAWSDEFASASFYVISEILSSQGNYAKALEEVKKSLINNGNNTEAANLQIMLLRKTGNISLASELIQSTMINDPLNFVLLYEQYLLSKSEKDKNTFITCMRNEAENYFELAARYVSAGLSADALSLLNIGIQTSQEKITRNPLTYYYLGYIQSLTANSSSSTESLIKAAGMSVKYCFPYGIFTEKVLQYAVQKLPEDAVAHYLLGNLLADNIPENALAEWQKAASLGYKLPTLYRNMAFIQANIFDNMEQAKLNIQKALAMNPDDPMSIIEADQYDEFTNVPVPQRYKKISAYENALMKSDKLIIRKVNTAIYMGKYDEAIQYITSNHFYVAEISFINPHTEWTNAYLYRGIQRLKQNDFTKAIADFRKALEFPRNLEIANDAKSSFAYYWMGIAYNLAGKFDSAAVCFKSLKNTDFEYGWGNYSKPMTAFYLAIVEKKLGNADECTAMLNTLLRNGKSNLVAEKHIGIDEKGMRVRQSFNETISDAYFSIALGSLGLGDYKGFNQNLEKAMKTMCNNVDMKMLNEDKEMVKLMLQ